MPNRERRERREEKQRRKQAARRAGARRGLAGLVAEPSEAVVRDIFLEVFARNKTAETLMQEKEARIERIQGRLATLVREHKPKILLDRQRALLAQEQESLLILRKLDAAKINFVDFFSKHLPVLIQTEMNNEKNIQRKSRFPRRDIRFRIGFMFGLHGIRLGIEVLAMEIEAAKERLEVATTMRDFAKEYNAKLPGKQMAFLEEEIVTYTNLLKTLPEVRRMSIEKRQKYLDYAKKSPWLAEQ